jgi:putative YphP/YqiW family bacilliredoxin
MIQPFRDELTRIGFSELRTPGDVDAALSQKGTQLLVINSVCGCAAGKARPGIADALRRSSAKPEHLTTVFAGGDVEATSRVRVFRRTCSRSTFRPMPISHGRSCAARSNFTCPL